MTKNILLLFLFSIIVISCGKKGDPEYKETKMKLKAKSSVELTIK